MKFQLKVLCFIAVFAILEAKKPDEDRESESLDYLVLGDWGGFHIGNTIPDQVAIADQMGIVGEEVDSEFTMALGDNFYIYGVQNDTDPRFVNTFEVCCCKN